MAAETPKYGEDSQPSQLGGCLPWFLRRFFVPQPPPGLEDFATKIHQRIDNHLTAQRQQQLKRRNAETARVADEKRREVEAAQYQRELEQEKTSTLAEAKKILDDFRVEEKLKYIQKTVWKGKGRIRLIEPNIEIKKDPILGIKNPIFGSLNILGGFELVHEYQLPVFREKAVYGSDGEGPYYRWQYEPETSGTNISIVIVGQRGSGGDGKMMSVRSEYSIGQRKEEYFGYGNGTRHEHYSVGSAGDIPTVDIPIESRDGASLLDSALAKETDYRLTHNLRPSQLEDRARAILAEAKRKPCWLKWTANAHDL